ncbi:MAG: ATP-binding cassette domain-containing protein [Actinomycetota bacterium]|nr:ATP-binding cassette domain-containing protein [Actinomycetota bacterium]
MAEIRLRGLSKSFGSNSVVRNVDLDVKDGEFIVLLGSSGCGKSTVLRMIAGLEKVTDGEIWIGGELVNDEPPSSRNVGMVFQNYALYPHLTVAGNLGFGLAARRRGRGRRAAREDERRQIRETAELLEIDHVLTHRPKELSGGQRQRVALGRAIIRRPDVFLMDEPLSNLDANLRERMRLELAQLHRKLRITTIYVTHDQGEALTLADRIVVLHDGQVHQVGTADDVYDRPADTYVARFLGSPGMNLYTLPPARIGDDLVLADGALRLPAAALPPGAGDGRPLSIGIRPEHLALAADPPGGPVSQGPRPAGSGDFPAEAAGTSPPDGATTAGRTVLRCRVDILERLGSHLLVHGSLSTGQTVIARLDAQAAVRQGEQIVLTARTADTHFFDPDSGDRLVTASMPQLAGARA